MADINDPAEAAERLERALDRIAALAAALPKSAPDPAPDSPGEETEAHAEVARRLDDLIGRIRNVLGPEAGG